MKNWKQLIGGLVEERSSTVADTKPVTRHGNKGVIVFPSRLEEIPGLTGSALFAFHRDLNRELPSLALVANDEILKDSPYAGNRILLSADYPELYLTAIRSASWVVSFDPYVLTVARSLGVPAFSLDEQNGSNGAPSAEAWLRRLKTVGSESYLPHLPEGPAEFSISCVADSQFIGFFFGLVDNLMQVCERPCKITLLALDEEAITLTNQQYPKLPISAVAAPQVWDEVQWSEFKTKPIAQRAYASKPRSLRYSLGENPEIPSYLSDVDIYFYTCPSQLNAHFDGAVLVFPQWSDQLLWARSHGVFNSGLMGARAGGEPLLNWWSEMCFHFSGVVPERGYFTDQGMLELSQWFFEGIQIYRGKDQNVAPWNRKTLGVSRQGISGGLKLKDGRAIQSYHAAGADSDGYFQLKFGWDQIVSFFSVLPNADLLKPLYQNTIDQQSQTWTHLRESIEIRNTWNRRLRKTPNKVEQSYVNGILPASTTTAWLKMANDAFLFLRNLLKGPVPGNPDYDAEMKNFVAIQQEFAFPAERLKLVSKRR